MTDKYVIFKTELRKANDSENALLKQTFPTVEEYPYDKSGKFYYVVIDEKEKLEDFTSTREEWRHILRRHVSIPFEREDTSWT
jgi:hypothetical protein